MKSFKQFAKTLTSKNAEMLLFDFKKEDCINEKKPGVAIVGKNELDKEYIKKAIASNVFVLTDSKQVKNDKIISQIKKSYRPSIPFTNIFFELPSGMMSQVAKSYPITAFWLETIDDDYYTYIALMDNDHLCGGAFDIETMRNGYSLVNGGEYFKAANHPAVGVFALTHMMCSILDSCKTATIDMGFTFKETTKKSGKEKTKHSKTKVTYLAGKNPPNLKYHGIGDSIEWGYEFKRRGHFRKIKPNSLGKNRAGEYCIMGETWVKEHKVNAGKGLPELKQIRVIK